MLGGWRESQTGFAMTRCAALFLTAALLWGCAGTSNRPTQLISGSAAAYPEGARAKGIEGLVVVRYDVAVDGRVINARVVRADPPDVFDDAALSSVRSWLFNPALVDGVPRATQNIESTVTFKLGAGDEYADY
jgi:TonB family protein